MYYHISQIRNQFKHNSNSKLLFGVTVAERRVILFYSNGIFFDYQLISKKILYSSNLGEKPFKVISVNPHQIICILNNSKTVISINIKKKQMVQLLKLPLHLSNDEVKDRTIFNGINIYSFGISHSFYIEETNQQQNKKRIIFFVSTQEKFNIKDYDSNNYIFEKIDQKSQIAIYKQKIQIDNIWEIKIVNLAQNFHQIKYKLQHKAFNTNSIVAQVIAKTNSEILIFLNGTFSQILLFDREHNQIRDFQYKINLNFKNVCFYNRAKQIACFCYLSNSRINGQLFENILELIDLEKRLLIERKILTLKQYCLGWEQDYLLDINPEHRNTNISVFHTVHFIKKKSLYLNMMNKSDILKRFGQEISQYVLDLLQ